MTSRERIRTIVNGEAADRCGLWLGNPDAQTWPILHEHFGTSDGEELRRLLNDDFRWIAPWSAYKHPEGKPMFDIRPTSQSLGAGGAFADCEDVDEVAAFEWPSLEHLDFTETLELLDTMGEVYRASGFWSPFFHQVADFFGMENYFVKMYTHPEVVHAVTRHLVDFYVQANARFFEAAGDRIDAFFFGNDFGTQQDLLVSPAAFDEFIFPYFRKLTEVGHAHGLQVILHSCGAIKRVIPGLIELGVDALHPLQALAADMDARTLAAEFKGRIAFIGGIDTQELLDHGTPEEVRDEVRRVKDLLGPAFVVSPSHEAILPNVPPENVRALAEAALEG
jgi:uroporphyrinogen decarboxylase